MKIGAAIQERRTKLGIERDELATKAKLHPNTLKAIEAGAESVQTRTLEAVAKVLGTTASALIRDAESRG